MSRELSQGGTQRGAGGPERPNGDSFLKRSPDSGRLLTVGEVCELIRVAQTFVYRHAQDLGAFKVGSHLRFRREDIESWLEAQRLGASDKPSPECQVRVDNLPKQWLEKRSSRGRKNN